MKKYISVSLYTILFLFVFQFNGYCQCTNNNHSTNANDMWLSCNKTANPNSVHGNGHWLMYDLGYVYDLGPTHFWNYNKNGQTNKGFKDLAIDYSMDGINWTSAGTFQLAQAPGNSNYSGMAGIDLSGIQAQYVLITGLTYWNNGSCAGLSEFKVEVDFSGLPCYDYMVTSNINANPVSTGVYWSNLPLLSDGNVQNTYDVTYKSTVAICLNSGFEAQNGAMFLAIIDDCVSPLTEDDQGDKSK